MKEDILTGFYVREELIPYLNKLINSGTPFTVGLIDLNGFKKYNDKYGHAFGDEILKYVASTLKLTVGGAGRIFRLGGDEFLVVFPNRDKRSVTNIFRFCNRNLHRRPFLSGNRLYRITASYGLAAYPQDAQDPKQLISLADKAMYFSKKTKKGNITDVRKISVLKLVIFIKKLIRLVIIVSIIFLGSKYAREPVLKFLEKFKIKGSVKEVKLPKFGEDKKTEVEKVETMKEIREPGEKQIPKEVKKTYYPIFVTVKLKNGFKIEGILLEEDSESLTLEVIAGSEKGKVIIEKNLILEVR